jgi:putative acetyltransferase
VKAEVRLAPAAARDLPLVRELFREYARSLGHDLGFQGFAAELAGLPGSYAPPSGALLVARADGEPAGCVALRRLQEGVCEMKRLFVRPAFRRSGLGRALATAVMAEAARLGYRFMRLDTIATMTAAVALYESLGFTEIPPYCHNPIAGARYYQCELESTAAARGARP